MKAVTSGAADSFPGTGARGCPRGAETIVPQGEGKQELADTRMSGGENKGSVTCYCTSLWDVGATGFEPATSRTPFTATRKPGQVVSVEASGSCADTVPGMLHAKSRVSSRFAGVIALRRRQCEGTDGSSLTVTQPTPPADLDILEASIYSFSYTAPQPGGDLHRAAEAAQ